MKTAFLTFLFFGSIANSGETLPSYSIHFAGEAPANIQVGDVLSLEVSPFPTQLTSVKFTTSNPTQPLNQQGWLIHDQIELTDHSILLHATPLLSGSLQLPPLLIQTPEGKDIGFTEPLKIEVGTTASKLDPKDYPFLPALGLPFPKTVLILGLGIIGLLIFFLIFTIAKRWCRRRRASKTPLAPLLPPKEDALSKLQSPEIMKLLQSSQYKKMYFLISEILKEYYGRSLNFDALESTTEEFLRYLKNKGLDDSQWKEVRDYFSILDRVKFSNYLPLEAETKGMIPDAKRLVR